MRLSGVNESPSASATARSEANDERRPLTAFGLCNAPATYSRLVRKLVDNFIHLGPEECICFLDGL